MELWIVIVEDRGEVFIHPFNCLEMARNYAREQCNPWNTTIERHVMNVGWQGKESLDDVS